MDTETQGETKEYKQQTSKWQNDNMNEETIAIVRHLLDIN